MIDILFSLVVCATSGCHKSYPVTPHEFSKSRLEPLYEQVFRQPGNPGNTKATFVKTYQTSRMDIILCGLIADHDQDDQLQKIEPFYARFQNGKIMGFQQGPSAKKTCDIVDSGRINLAISPS